MSSLHRFHSVTAAVHAKPFATTVIAFCALAIGACGDGSGKAPSGLGGATRTESGSARVIYKSSTHVMSLDAARKMIRGISTNGAGLLLDGVNRDAQSLGAGDTLVIKELAARKILGVKKLADGSIIALTQPASLLDAVEEAHIVVSKPVRFGELTQANSADTQHWLSDLLVPSAHAQGTKDGLNATDAFNNAVNGVTGVLIDGWTSDFQATPSKDRVTLAIKLTKEVAGFRAVITGEGYLQNFDMDGDIDIEKGAYEKLQTGFKNVNGVMNFKWEVATEGPGVHTGDDRIKLPAAIEVPLYKALDGFPLFLELSSALIIKPALSGGREYSRGSFRITYDGYQNFSAKKGNIDADGKVTGDIDFLEAQNISPTAPMGMVVGFAVPRIELTFGVSKILKFGDMKDAAGKVDAATDFLAKELMTPDQYAAFKSSPVGQIGLSKAIDNALKSDAAAYFEFVASAGMSNTGMSVVTPCTRHDIHLLAKVGVSAEVFGQDVGRAEKDVYTKDFTRIDPPGTDLCEAVGT